MTNRLRDEDLAARVRATLADRARRLPPAPRPFQLDAVSRFEAPPAAPHRSWWRPAAAVALVACALAAVVFVTSRRGDSGAVTSGGPTSSVGSTTAPAGAVPSALVSGPTEDGLPLWSITWGPLPPMDTALRTELFGAPGPSGAKVLVRISSPIPGSTGAGTEVTVRGQSGQVAPAKEFPEVTSSIVWQEDASMQADFAGLSQQDAVAFLGTLVWRGPDHQQGLDAPPGSALGLLGESDGRQPGSPVAADLLYRDQPVWTGPDTGREIEVRTTEAAGGVTFDYLNAWFHGVRGADLTAQSFDPSFGSLLTVTPDGQSVWVDGRAVTTDRAVLQSITDHVTRTSGAELLARRAAAEQRVAQLPLVGSVALPSGSVGIHATADARAVCLLVDGQTERCSEPSPASGITVGSFVVDGRWYVVSAAVGPLYVTTGDAAGPYTPANPAAPQELAVEHGDAGGLGVILCQPPDGITNVLVGDTQQVGVTRPPF
jgi:hypothetical protein